jgi:phage portal protein BeeE
MGLLDRLAASRGGESRYSADSWLADYLIPSVESGMYGYGSGMPLGVRTTYDGQRIQEISETLPGHMAALRSSPPAFAAQALRARVLSQARFKFRNRDRKLFGTGSLRLLEEPWPSATTADLVSRMEWHAGLAGNAFCVRQADRLRVPRPDWVGIVYGSESDADDSDGALSGFMLDSKLLGYVYQAGGIGNGRSRAQLLLPDEVAHWYHDPDPESPGTGMSWITPAVRDIQGDRAAAAHKLQFFANGATPNMVVKGITAANREQFDEIVDMLEARHAGLGNAYRTLYLTTGADATVVGANLRQIDFSTTLATGETRITYLSGVPATLLGISKGLEGSSLNAGNFDAARRTFGDTWMRPSLQSLSASLAPIVDVPGGAELWFDTSDVSLLHDDVKVAAEVTQTDAITIGGLVREGFTADSAVAAVIARDMSLLKHTGLVSVQQRKPGDTTGQQDGGAA